MSKKNHSNDKITHMVAQMVNFKCSEEHYSTKYVSSYIKPKIWWSMVDDSDNYLKSLSLKLFSITPHSVVSERAFSILGFCTEKGGNDLVYQRSKGSQELDFFCFQIRQMN